jgi:hypothetical protein
MAAALSGGYHLTWAIGAGLMVAAIVVAMTVLKPEPAPPSAAVEDEAEEMAGADGTMCGAEACA